MYVGQRGNKLRHTMPLSAELKYIRVGLYSYSFIHSFILERKVLFSSPTLVYFHNVIQLSMSELFNLLAPELFF